MKEVIKPPSGGTYRLPANEYLFRRLHPLFREFLAIDQQFRSLFSRLEYLVALISQDLRDWYIPGTYTFGVESQSQSVNHLTAVEQEINELGESWPLLKLGAFRGDLTRLKQAKEVVDKQARDTRTRWEFE